MIHVETVSTDIGTVCKQVRITKQDEWKDFQELIQRGANLWPDAPPHIKELADLITNGKVMQDYHRQAGLPITNPMLGVPHHVQEV